MHSPLYYIGQCIADLPSTQLFYWVTYIIGGSIIAADESLLHKNYNSDNTYRRNK